LPAPFVDVKTQKTKKTETKFKLMLRKDPNAKPKKIAAANLQTASFAVEGMTCA
jgi:hypothetical protein